MTRKWTTTLTARGDTAAAAVAALWDDEYADRINGAIYVRPVHDKTTVQEMIDILQGLSPILGWVASVDIEVER